MESLHYLLMKSHLMLSRKILAEAAKIGLTAGQPKVLDFLRVHEEADQKTIASYCEIEVHGKPHVSRINTPDLR